MTGTEATVTDMPEGVYSAYTKEGNDHYTKNNEPNVQYALLCR